MDELKDVIALLKRPDFDTADIDTIKDGFITGVLCASMEDAQAPFFTK